jgi:hypothetical protein
VKVVRHFRQGRLDKFFIAPSDRQQATELDFMSVANMLKPTDSNETRKPIPPSEFYELLNRNKASFNLATTQEMDEAQAAYRGSHNDSFILKRLKDKSVYHCQQFTEDDENFVAKVIRLVEDGALPKATAKQVAVALKQSENFEPLKVLAVLRHGIKTELFQNNPVTHGSQTLAPRDVILSSLLVK